MEKEHGGKTGHVKEWLNRGWYLQKEIRQLEEAKRKAYSAVTGGGIDYEREKVQTGSGNAMEEKMVSYVAYQQAVDQIVEQLYCVQGEIAKAISQIEESQLRTLLAARYLNHKTWEQVAVDMGYSYRQVLRLHGQALWKMKDVIACHTGHGVECKQ